MRLLLHTIYLNVIQEAPEASLSFSPYIEKTQTYAREGTKTPWSSSPNSSSLSLHNRLSTVIAYDIGNRKFPIS